MAIRERDERPVLGSLTGNDHSSLGRALELLGVRAGPADSLIESLPFSKDDATAGAENEFLAVVVGRKEDADLPITIEHSNYYANIIKRAAAGDAVPKSHLTVGGLPR